MSKVKSIQVNFQNWGLICDSVPKDNFIRGCYLNPKTLEEISDTSSQTIGVKLLIDGEEVLVKEGEYVNIYPGGKIVIGDKIQEEN